MWYKTKSILTQKLWNNAFAWEERVIKYSKSPTLTVAAIKNGIVDDVRVGTNTVFEEVENRKLRSCIGLENFVRIEDNMIVFDNHNHALYFWIEAVR